MLVSVDPEADGVDVAPAIITRVHSDTVVDLRVLTNSDRSGVPWKTSVTLCDSRPENDVDHCAWWPPREDAVEISGTFDKADEAPAPKTTKR